MRFSKLLAAAGLILFLFSCRKDFRSTETKNDEVYFPVTVKENERVAIIKEVAKILEDVYKEPYAYYEVNAAIYSEYYADERVLLKDLLFPETSSLYQTQKFKDRKPRIGIFKTRFYEVLGKSNFPILKKLLAPFMPGSTNRQNASFPAPELEIFSNSDGVSIYFPYSENFGSNFTPEYFDLTDRGLDFLPPTLVPADRDADSAPAGQPYVCETAPGDFYICLRPVTVNDSYAEIHETHIIGVGAEPTGRVAEDPPPPPGVPINRVYHGWSKLGTQLDKLISFTGNGGGSEMKVCRVSGYLQFQDQQVTNFSGDVTTIFYSRKTIRKNRYQRVVAVWDPNWVEGNLEQVYAAYEEDTKGTKTLSGSLSTTVTLGTGNTASGNIGYNITVSTQDELVTQRKQDRYSYFRDAKNDQGWGVIQDNNDFLPPNQDWPIFDGGTIWAYTWPYRVF